MTCIHMMGAIVCVSPWGRVKLGNRYVMIDFHEYLGPSFSYVKGNEYYDPKDENDPIWPLFEVWFEKYQAKKAKRDAERATLPQTTEQGEKK